VRVTVQGNRIIKTETIDTFSKPKEKVKKWKWLYRDKRTNRHNLTKCHYENYMQAEITFRGNDFIDIIEPIEETMIEE